MHRHTMRTFRQFLFMLCLFHENSNFAFCTAKVSLLYPLPSAPCALLVPNEKDSQESLWPCITKWTLLEFNVDYFYWMFNKFAFCLKVNIQFFFLPLLLHERSIQFKSFSLPFECSTNFAFFENVQHLWMFNKFCLFGNVQHIWMFNKFVSHTFLDIWHFLQSPQGVMKFFVSTNSFSNLYLG